MKHAILALLGLSACTSISVEQSDLRAQARTLQATQITLDCGGTARTLDILGGGRFLRDGRTVFWCTTPLAGGLACTYDAQRRVIDYETQTASLTAANGVQTTCTF